MVSLPDFVGGIRSYAVLLVFAIAAALSLHAGAALLLGMVYALLPLRRPDPWVQRLPSVCLQAGVVVLGLSLPVTELMATGRAHVLPVLILVPTTLVVGMAIGRLLGSDKLSSLLLSAGTAICGGTAVASIAPVIRAPARQTADVLVVIFVLNAVALWLFPWLAKLLELGDQAFGVWCALAIHDTSSVVGAAATHGEAALKTATTIKLIRALMLIPTVVMLSALQRAEGRARLPGFVIAFVVVSVLATVQPLPAWLTDSAAQVSRVLFCLALLLIGTTMSPRMLWALDRRVLGQGVLVWLAVSGATLVWVTA